MGFKLGTTCFICQTAINNVPFLLLMISIRIRDVIIKTRFSGGFGTVNPLLCGRGLIADVKSGYFTVCLDLQVTPVMYVTRK